MQWEPGSPRLGFAGIRAGASSAPDAACVRAPTACAWPRDRHETPQPPRTRQGCQSPAPLDQMSGDRVDAVTERLEGFAALGRAGIEDGGLADHDHFSNKSN